MAKNRMFHAKKKYIDHKMPPLLNQIYASIALAIWNILDMQDEEKNEIIEAVFAESQSIWYDVAESGEDIMQLCEDITGIDLKN